MKRRNPEAKLQRIICQHLEKRGVPGLVWWHTPNGGSRNAIEAKNLKLMGVRAGVSDFILLRPPGQFFALELKAEKGRTTDAQDAFLSDVRRAGGYSMVANGLDEALYFLRFWGCIKGVENERG